MTTGLRAESRGLLLPLAVLLSALLSAQAPVVITNDLAQLEQQHIEGRRSGQNLERFYARTYRGITALGQYEDVEQIRTLKPDPTYARHHNVMVDLHGNAAIVTGTEGAADTGDRERVLR